MQTASSYRPGPSRRPAPAGSLFVGSEIGTLRRVLLHRPDLELRRLTPANREPLLFHDVLWAKRARQEHDAFADALAEAGVEVLYLQELLADVLADESVRAEVIARTFELAKMRPRLGEPARAWLESLAANDVASLLIGGIAYRDLPFKTGGLAAQVEAAGAFALQPLPNQMFVRDTSAWICNGVSIAATATEARRRESLHVDVVYRHHPLFAGVEHEIWSDGLSIAPSFGGRDVLVIGDGVVMIATSAQARPAAVEELAERLFAAGAVRRVLAIPLPTQSPPIHLDGVLSMVDSDAFIVNTELKDSLRAFLLGPGRTRVSIEPEGELFATVADVLDLPKVRLIETGGDRYDPAVAEWEDGNNLLALAPGLVVAYERNAETNARLRHAGVEVLSIEGFELGRGRSGPRSLSCPLERDRLPDHV
jgi:arginine deiminase